MNLNLKLEHMHNILIIDDDTSLRRVLEYTSRKRVRRFTAADGETGLIPVR